MTDADLIQSALAADNRTAEELERDERSKPETILGLLDLQPGDHAADVLGGGGYYAVLMANVVGPDGEDHPAEQHAVQEVRREVECRTLRRQPVSEYHAADQLKSMILSSARTTSMRR